MPVGLRIGDRVRLSGGYDPEPNWLQGQSAYTGTVLRFIPGQNAAPAAVVQLDRMLEGGTAMCEIAVLELRYANRVWTDENVVHVELCDFIPEAKPWPFRRQGRWVESNATCSRVSINDTTSR